VSIPNGYRTILISHGLVETARDWLATLARSGVIRRRRGPRRPHAGNSIPDTRIGTRRCGPSNGDTDRHATCQGQLPRVPVRRGLRETFRTFALKNVVSLATEHLSTLSSSSVRTGIVTSIVGSRRRVSGATSTDRPGHVHAQRRWRTPRGTWYDENERILLTVVQIDRRKGVDPIWRVAPSVDGV